MAKGNDRALTPFGDFLRDVAKDIVPTWSSRPAAPKGREKWPKLRTPVIPAKGESLRGLVYRACHKNFLPNSFGLLKPVGLLNRNRVLVSEGPHIQIEELAHAIGIDDHEAVSRRYPNLRRRHYSFFGLNLHKASIEDRKRNFSPTTFQQDLNRAGGPRADKVDLTMGPFHRATWELRDIPFCLDSWDMLQDRCWCEAGGIVQRWTRTATGIHECDKCGDPLAELEAYPVPFDMRPALSILRALAHPDPIVRRQAAIGLPSDIRDCDRSQLFHLVVRIGRAVDPIASERSFEEPRARLQGLWTACNALTRWPDGIFDVTWDPDTPQSAKGKIASKWHQLSPISIPPTLSKRLKSSNFLNDSPNAANAVGIRPATEIAKLSRHTLLWAWENGHFSRHQRVHGSKRLPAFDREEVARFGDDWRKRVEPVSLAFELGISLYGVEQIAALGIIPADAPAIPGTGPHFHPEAVETFFNELENISERRGVRHDEYHLQESVSLAHAMRHIGGRPKPWGPVFSLLLNRRIPFSIVDGVRLADSIAIPSRYLPAIKAATFDRCDPQYAHFQFTTRANQTDALDLLNAGVFDVRVLEGIRSEGNNPKFYDLEEVERRAKKYVCIPEIAARLGIPCPNAYQKLLTEGFVPVRPGRWDRKSFDSLY